MPTRRSFAGVSRPVLVSATALLAVVSVASMAFAQEAAPPANQPPPPPHMRPKFSDLDTNKDGVIDKAEFAAPLAKPFADMDTNHDGVISQAEFEAFKPEHGKPEYGKPEHGPNPGPGHGPGNGPDHPQGPGSNGGHADGPQGGAHMPPPGGPDLADLDANKDGKVTLDEFLAHAKAHFDKLDTNHDGVLDASELPKPPEGAPPPPASK